MCMKSYLVPVTQGMLEKLAQQQLMAQIDMSQYIGTPILFLRYCCSPWQQGSIL